MSQRALIIKFTNMSPIHIGKGRDSYDVASPMLPSDGLSAALAALKAQHGSGDDIQTFLEAFAVTSAFPYIGNVLFLPKAAGRLNVKVRGQQEEQYRKKLKKLEWVAWGLWTQLARGSEVVVEEAQIQGAFLLEAPSHDFIPPMRHEIHQRVSVSRDGEDAIPFSFDWTFFQPDSGLYCMVQLDKPEMREEVVALFHELGEQGIGSDRSVGGGHFNVTTSECELPSLDNGNAVMLLSNYIPTESELAKIDLDHSRYSIVRRGGFIAGGDERVRHLRRNTVHMFTTGSVLAGMSHVTGRVVNLTPHAVKSFHPVYRSGKAFCVTISNQ